METDFHPELKALLDFYVEQRSKPPASFSYSPRLISAPSFFSIRKLQEHLNNPLLTPNWIALVSRGQFVPLEPAYIYKNVQKKELFFMDKELIDHHLGNGAALLLEGLDILDSSINSFAAKLDSALPCALTNVVAFFSQRGNEAYKGHADRDDVLVMQLEGEKRWSLFAPKQRKLSDKGGFTKEEMGQPISELTMKPGDALYLRAGTPHICQTTGNYSLHVSFDLQDLTPTMWQITEAANTRFDSAAAEQYSAPSKVIDKYLELLRSDKFRNDVTLVTNKTRSDAHTFRRRMGKTSVVRALSKLSPSTE
jgi:hypothetical protein